MPGDAIGVKVEGGESRDEPREGRALEALEEAASRHPTRVKDEDPEGTVTRRRAWGVVLEHHGRGARDVRDGDVVLFQERGDSSETSVVAAGREQEVLVGREVRARGELYEPILNLR